MKTGVSLLCMGAGNVLVLKETFESFKGICDEFVYGDLLIFAEDREILNSYQEEYNIKIVPFKFNYLYQAGFSNLLNALAKAATNNTVLYMNTSEVVDENYGALEAIKSNPDCNSFYFTHRQEKHRWFRCYDRRDLQWDGLIHEELRGEYRPHHRPIFMMKDLEKDLIDPFKAKVLNSLKECVYWNQLIKIVDNNNLLGATNPGWLQFAQETYQSMKDRLAKKPRQIEALEKGDLKLFMMDVYTSEEFKTEEFKSSNMIAFQGDKKHLL